jgi:hypothetical protein
VRAASGRRRQVVVAPVPLDEAPQAGGERRELPRLAEQGVQAGDVRAGRGHVALLHRLHLQLRRHAQRGLQLADEIQQGHRLAAADIEHALRHRVRGRLVQHGQHTRDHVIDVGEVAQHACRG